MTYTQIDIITKSPNPPLQVCKIRFLSSKFAICGENILKAYDFWWYMNLLLSRDFASLSSLTVITTYNVLLRYLAFVSRCYSLLPIMLKIFDVICQWADEFYEKRIFFHILVGVYPSKSVRASSLLLSTICKWQFSVSGQIFFNRADKNKSTVSVLCLIVFGHALLYEWH